MSKTEHSEDPQGGEFVPTPKDPSLVPFTSEKWQPQPTELIGICHTCKWRRGPWNCAAYPAGIPDRILTGQEDHHKPLPGDRGIQYVDAGRNMLRSG